MKEQAIKQRCKDLRQLSFSYRISLAMVARRAGINYSRLMYILNRSIPSLIEMDALEEAMLKMIEEQRNQLKEKSEKSLAS